MNLQEPFQTGLRSVEAHISKYAFEEALAAIRELQASLDAPPEDPSHD